MIEKKLFTFDEVKQKMVNYCVYQDRCHFEVEQKMLEYMLIPEAKDEILLYLMSENYLNEERFARSYARGKFYIKGWGKNKIKMYLQQKRISDKLINTSFEEINEKDYQEKLISLIDKNTIDNKGLIGFSKTQKLIKLLISKGYEYSLILDILDEKKHK
jgi:regulatory protein